ncbi:MAG: hypothetical protein GY716_18760 [bacterium]|nr:hypothetical protein [bacterium]
MKTSFRVLDAELELGGPREIVEPIVAAYARFVTHDALERAVRIEVDPSCGAIRVGERTLPLIAGLDATSQLYQQFLASVMDNVASHAILHAAALEDRSGGALLLAGPSGHGKSSLTLGLATRGLGFLSDDYAPLDLERREVSPYPRRVAMLPNGTAPVPPAFAEASRRAGAARLFDKTLVDVADVLGADALRADPCPLRHVFLLCPALGEPEPLPTLIDLGVRAEAAEELRREFDSVAGVETVDEQSLAGLVRWRLSVDSSRRPTEALSRLLVRDEVVYCEKHWARRPDFTSRPEAEPVKRRVAAEQLGRELLNRRDGGRLFERYGASIAALFLDLAAALRDASCWRVRVGRYEDTVNLIGSLSGLAATDRAE